MTDIEEAYIDGLVKIANHPKVIQACEPHLSSHHEIHFWQVLRVLRAQELLLSGLAEKSKKT